MGNASDVSYNIIVGNVKSQHSLRIHTYSLTNTIYLLQSNHKPYKIDLYCNIT